LVFDPVCGRGTTALACQMLGWRLLNRDRPNQRLSDEDAEAWDESREVRKDPPSLL
jgi:DNA modification methylase